MKHCYSCALLLLFSLFACLSCEKWDLDKENFLSLVINEVSAVSLDSARIDGAVLDIEGVSVDQHGILWNKGSEAPDILVHEGEMLLGSIAGKNEALFSINIHGLLPGTGYTIRAFAQLKGQNFYSEPVFFNTQGGEVITQGYLYISGNSIELTGRVTGTDAGVFALSHGFCWSNLQTEPTLADSSINLGGRRSSLPFTYQLGGLLNGPDYYFRAFAILQNGLNVDTVYGRTLLFNAGLVDAYTPKASPGFSGREGMVGFSINGKGYFGTGARGNEYYKDFWEYQPETDTWAQAADLGAPSVPNVKPRAYATAFALNNQGFVGMGRDDAQARLKDYWQYDGNTNSWTRLTAVFPGPARNAAFSFTIGDKAYVGGGEDNNTSFQDFYQFDPSGPAWLGQASIPSLFPPPLGESGIHNTVGFSINGKGYFGTGFSHNPNPPYFNYAVSNFYEFDPDGEAQGAWQEKSPVIWPLYRALGFALDGKGYIGSGSVGYGDNRTMLEYDPGTDTWIKKNDFPEAGLSNATGILIGDRFYFGFGYREIGQGSGFVKAYYDNFWEYDPL